MTTTSGGREHDVELRNRRLLRILVGIISALVLGCFAIGTRW
jgi:hypothetical protein